MSDQRLSERPVAQGITKLEIDQRVFDLHDEYCRGHIDRREFPSRTASIAVLDGTGLAMAQGLLLRYALAQTISFTDQRIKASYVTYPSIGGNSGTMAARIDRAISLSKSPGRFACFSTCFQ